MAAHYAPTCPACRAHDPESFRLSCQGCQARKAHLEAERQVPALSRAQVEGMDSTMQPLEPR
jgi:hypothetical protein